MSQALRNAKALGAKQEDLLHWCPVTILSHAGSGSSRLQVSSAQ